ncbi:MAG: AMP-binding protein, partial [Thermodesulfobacteriota bacterium]|nr:AMP-binding protein [Thermodesulfobacteriota bacterium]
SKCPPWGDFSCLDEELWKKDGWIVWMTTGTSGAPVPCRYTQFDRVTQAWSLARQWTMSGVKSDDLVMWCMPFMTHVFAWDHYVAQETAKIPLIAAGPPMPSEARLGFIMQYNPTVLMGTPTYMIYLAESMKEKGIDPRNTSVRVVVVAGEPGGSLLSTRKRLMALWDVEVSDLFGSTEVGPWGHATMCDYEGKDHGRDANLHYIEDVGIPEVLDPDTLEPMPEGEYGALVWSNINSIAQPILRFNLNDMVNLRRIDCPCGRTYRMSEGGIVGRTDDMIIIRGVNVFPTNIEEAIRSMDDFGNEYTVKIVEDDKGMPDLIVQAEVAPEMTENDYDRLAKELQESIKDKCQVRVTVEPVPFGSMPRAEFKSKRLIDMRRK